MSFRRYDVSVFSRKPVNLTTVPSTLVFVDPPTKEQQLRMPVIFRLMVHSASWKRTVLRLLDSVSVCIPRTHTLQALQGFPYRRSKRRSHDMSPSLEDPILTSMGIVLYYIIDSYFQSKSFYH
jgi:hypothetical protein